jgi:Putative Actinobacterial Holin-X, holin superfamily III
VDPSSNSTNGERGESSLADLTKRLSEDVSRLVRKEAELARAEVAAKARRLAVGMGLAATAALLGLVVLGALTAAAILALATTVSAWLAALIVGVVAAVIAGALVMIGTRLIRRATPPVPAETVESVKEDIAWLKTQARSGMR